jgi:hypothetical protein
LIFQSAGRHAFFNATTFATIPITSCQIFDAFETVSEFEARFSFSHMKRKKEKKRFFASHILKTMIKKNSWCLYYPQAQKGDETLLFLSTLLTLSVIFFHNMSGDRT